MISMRAASKAVRLVCAALFLLLLAVRSLAPAGFMPTFDHGALAIVACPDGDASPGIRMHHDGHHKSGDQVCPYAAASALGALGPDHTSLVESLLLCAALLVGRVLLFAERVSGRDRPPATGPPIPA